MNQLIKIGNQEVIAKEFNGQRVVTFRDIDLVHERPDGTARRSFTDNKDRLQSGRDYFTLSLMDENRTLGIDIPNRGITVITERGYLMLVKSFTDDLAWEVQGQLVDTYFKKIQRPLTTEQIMRAQLSMIDEVSERVDKLENTMVIDYGQQRVLERLVNSTVVTALCGKGSTAYKEIGKKVFKECNKDIQDRFDVNSRNNVPKMKYDEACEYIKKWQPCTNTKMLIEDCNALMSIA
ncbi:ORF6C domain-containing protein [Lachnoclostridium sp.]|uniref:ORF6C domain-containing protein n=1 Tax=Lachnoclostridium sp. TaxID=2028282 RepID=UPI0028972255|nr:ORF6C domain-containing protein [Lachnoclostridium sp.]